MIINLCETVDEINDMRQEARDRMLSGRGEDLESAMARYEAGTFGCHEVLDRLELFSGQIERDLLNHPGVLLDGYTYLRVYAARQMLLDVYQVLADYHLRAETNNGEEDPGDGQPAGQDQD